jgi:hypothetical protein
MGQASDESLTRADIGDRQQMGKPMPSRTERSAQRVAIQATIATRYNGVAACFARKPRKPFQSIYSASEVYRCCARYNRVPSGFIA